MLRHFFVSRFFFSSHGKIILLRALLTEFWSFQYAKQKKKVKKKEKACRNFVRDI